jgi:hypothetical protein
MSALRDAARQALEALEWASDLNAVAQNHTPLHDTITALRAALAQEEPAPAFVHRKLVEVHADGTETWAETPLYTHPPRREWQGLTEEEIYPLYSEPSSDAEMVEFARAIEALAKEKNHG